MTVVFFDEFVVFNIECRIAAALLKEPEGLHGRDTVGKVAEACCILGTARCLPDIRSRCCRSAPLVTCTGVEEVDGLLHSGGNTNIFI